MGTAVAYIDYPAVIAQRDSTIVQKSLEISSLNAVIASLNSTIDAYHIRESELNSWIPLKQSLDDTITSLHLEIDNKNMLLGSSADELTILATNYHELKASLIVSDLETSNLRDYYASQNTKLQTDYDNFLARTQIEYDLLNAKYPFDLSLALTRYNSSGSLDGNGCEFKDGSSVSVEGRNFPYIVVRSFQTLVGDSSYTVMYDLVAQTGSVLTAPEAMLTALIVSISQP